MLLIAEKGIREIICHVTHRYAKANNNYMKNYDNKRNHHILMIGTKIISMAGQCQKSCL